MSVEINVEGIIETELIVPPKKTKTTRVPKEPKEPKEPKIPKPKKVKEIPESPYFRENEFTEFYGANPELISWKNWVNCCNIIRGTDLFKKLYKNEFFEWGALENTAHIYPVWAKEPEPILNFDGVQVDLKPGIYDENLTMVLPPKFFFPTYRRYLLSQPGLDHVLNNVDVKPFQKYDFVTKAPPRPEQQECVDLAEDELKNKKYFKGIIQAPPGWGKAVYNEILLETPCGNIKMGDIREGDMVFGRDGKPTEVLRVYPQGKVKLYKFTFGDTTSTIVSGDHLWTVWNTDVRKWQDLTTNEIMSKNYARPEKDKRYGDKSNGMRYKYFIPLCKPVEYNFDISDPSRNRGLQPLQHCFHPYALGLMLGDGSFRPDGNELNFSDKFRKNSERLFSSLRENGYIDDLSIFDKESSSFIIFRSKKLKELSKIFGLDGKYSIEKHIPYEYLHASVESRKLLLEGLIATDGYVRTKSSWSYSTSSPQLKEDVCKLARSLGYYVTVKTNKNNTYIHNDEKKQTQNTNWEICINYEKERKAICKIEEIEDGEATCILVEADDSLFLCNDYIVTHNTYTSIRIGSLTNTQILIVVPNKLLAEQWTDAVTTFTDLTADDIGFLKGSNIKALTKKGQMKKPVLIALVQSLDSQLNRVPFEELREFYRHIGAVFYDETHTSGAADGYAKTSGIFTTFNVIGLSATPYKKGTNLFQLYTGIGQIKYISTHQNLIPTCNMHMLPVRISQKERESIFKVYEQGNWALFLNILENLLFKDHYYFTFLSEWLLYRYKQGYSSVVLFKTNQMLEKLQRYVNDKSKELNLEVIPKSVILTSETAKTQKQLINSSDIVFSNFRMFSAGADYQHLSNVFFASMVLGKVPIIQTLGRVTRKFSDKIQDVQAHFFIPDFIYPLFSSNEPHLTIIRAVKTQYPESQFKWDKGFNEYFEKKKAAAENLVAEDYTKFQTQQHRGHIPETGKGPMQGSFIVNDTTTGDNRLTMYQQQQQYNQYQQYQQYQANQTYQQPNGFPVPPPVPQPVQSYPFQNMIQAMPPVPQVPQVHQVPPISPDQDPNIPPLMMVRSENIQI